MLHYTPQHVSSSTLLIIRRTNCITTASGIVTLCKQLYGCLQRVTIPEAVPSKVWVYGHWIAWIVGSNPAECMDVYLLGFLW